MTFDISFSFPFYSQTVWFTGVLLESGEVWKENSSMGLRYRKVTCLPLWLSPEGLRVGPIRSNEHLIFCSIVDTRQFPFDCSSSASSTLVTQESNLGQTHRKKMVYWVLFWCSCFRVLWSSTTRALSLQSYVSGRCNTVEDGEQSGRL